MIRSSRRGSRRLPPTLVSLVLLAAVACRADPPRDAPVRTTSPAGSWTAPSPAEAASRDMALLRVVSAIPGAARLDLFAGPDKLFDVLEYRSVTPFVEVPAGRHAFRLRPAGLDTAEPLAEESRQVRAGRHYTAIVMPGVEGRSAAALRITEDPMDEPGEGRAALRIVHAASDAGRVDVLMPGEERLASGLDFQDTSELRDVEPTAPPIEIRPSGRSEAMLRLDHLRLSAGGIYTVVLIGRTRIDPPLETLVVEDRLGPR